MRLNKKPLKAAFYIQLFCWWVGYQKMVGTNGLEPSTPWMSTKCSNQLSYAPMREHIISHIAKTSYSNKIKLLMSTNKRDCLEIIV